MVGGDTELVMQELVVIRRDLATLMAGMEAAAVRQETIVAALEALRADLAQIVEISNGRRANRRAVRAPIGLVQGRK